MKPSVLVQKLIKDFLVVFASIIIMITFLRQIYYPTMSFDLKEIYIIMIFSFISALIGFILSLPNVLNDKSVHLKMLIHFITLEFVLISLCSIVGIVNSVFDGIILGLQICVIYILVRLLAWQNDKKDAKQINEKLNGLKDYNKFS